MCVHMCMCVWYVCVCHTVVRVVFVVLFAAGPLLTEPLPSLAIRVWGRTRNNHVGCTLLPCTPSCCVVALLSKTMPIPCRFVCPCRRRVVGRASEASGAGAGVACGGRVYEQPERTESPLRLPLSTPPLRIMRALCPSLPLITAPPRRCRVRAHPALRGRLRGREWGACGGNPRAGPHPGHQLFPGGGPSGVCDA
jgi:hypothetical protein